MKRLRERQLLGWLDERIPARPIVTGFNHWTGFDAMGWDASVWVLNAMYETEDLPGRISHDDVQRIERAAGAAEPDEEWPALDALVSRAALSGSALGRSASPGADWRRLRWRELADRLGIDPFTSQTPPDGRWFPYASWPTNIAPPAEGSLDREQFVTVIGHLAAVSPGGGDTPCVAFYGEMASRVLDELTAFGVTLDELVQIYDDDDLPGSPSNIWPEDRSWFVYTDWDYWATKISGSHELVQACATTTDWRPFRCRTDHLGCDGELPGMTGLYSPHEDSHLAS